MIHRHLPEPRDLYLVAFLNLTVSALALSTLTTRFVFPQFSLEGKCLWILSMSPIRLSSIVLQKFISSSLLTGVAVTLILLLTSRSLRFDAADTFFFIAAIGLISVGLNGLAVGLGVLFPNLKESNTAKIVSGFGGTLCLVASFVYIAAMVIGLVVIRSEVFVANTVSEGWIVSGRTIVGAVVLVGLTAVAAIGPLVFSVKKLEKPGFNG